MIKSYKDLQIWQISMDLVESIYRITEKLPSNEQFGLISQMRRAAVSVPSNTCLPAGRLPKDMVDSQPAVIHNFFLLPEVLCLN